MYWDVDFIAVILSNRLCCYDTYKVDGITLIKVWCFGNRQIISVPSTHYAAKS